MREVQALTTQNEIQRLTATSSLLQNAASSCQQHAAKLSTPPTGASRSCQSSPRVLPPTVSLDLRSVAISLSSLLSAWDAVCLVDAQLLSRLSLGQTPVTQPGSNRMMELGSRSAQREAKLAASAPHSAPATVRRSMFPPSTDTALRSTHSRLVQPSDVASQSSTIDNLTRSSSRNSLCSQVSLADEPGRAPALISRRQGSRRVRRSRQESDGSLQSLRAYACPAALSRWHVILSSSTWDSPCPHELEVLQPHFAQLGRDNFTAWE